MVQESFFTAFRCCGATLVLGVAVTRLRLTTPAACSFIVWVAHVSYVLVLLFRNDGCHVRSKQVMVLGWNLTQYFWVIQPPNYVANFKVEAVGLDTVHAHNHAVFAILVLV